MKLFITLNVLQSDGIHIWPLLAGLGLFLFGMHLLEEAIKNLAGRSFKSFLRKNTDTTFKAIASGAIVTAVLQSSSLVILLVMSLAGAGILGLNNGIGMILGANLGTTMTGWLVALVGFKLNIEAVILPFLAIGGLSLIISKNERMLNASKLLLGFSILFLGLNYMKNSFSDISNQLDFTFLVGKPLVLFSLFGFIFTAIIQSSSASMTIYLSSLAAGIISLPQAAFLMIGSDLGSSVTALIGTMNGNAIRKKVGYSHFLFNIYSAGIGMALANFYLYIIKNWLGNSDPLTSLTAFHSILNLLGIFFFLPLLKKFIAFLESYVKPDNETQAKYIHAISPSEPVAGIELLEKETDYFIRRVYTFNKHIFNERLSAQELLNEYFNIKLHENEITEFYLPIQQLSLNEDETIRINNLIASVRNAALSSKDLKDIIHNLDEFKSVLGTDIQTLQKQIKDNQQSFYRQFDYFLQNMQVLTEPDLQTLTETQKIFFKNETDFLYKINIGSYNEFNKASMLNVLREIGRSNESIIKAIKYYIAK
jgi:phosphate:Na+ symporter